MCRYGMSGPYKSHYACFSCRKAFKQPTIDDFLESRGCGYVYRVLAQCRSDESVLQQQEQQLGHRLLDLQEEYDEAIRKCPECGVEMIDMGLDFKPPRQSHIKAWQILQGMYRVGHAFHTCGCDGPGWIPKSTSDYRVYLTTQKRHYESELKRVLESPTLSLLDRKEDADYWMSRVDAIQQEQLG